MTYSHEDIIDALIVIKQTCKDFASCEDGCPFLKDSECCINSTHPIEWTLNETNQKWQAFL